MKYKEFGITNLIKKVTTVEKVIEIVKKEPDKYRFSWKGFDCFIIRHPEYLCLNGYVAITKLSPRFYQKDCFDKDFPDIECHGGFTFSNSTLKWWKIKKRKSAWWLGFDCNHYLDFAPGFVFTTEKILGKECVDREELENGRSTYKNLDYVINECKGIVNQILEM